MGAGGFEPPKHDAADLQSVPFGHSGKLPYSIVSSIKKWSWWTDSNPRPADYKSAALPAELHQRKALSVLYFVLFPDDLYIISHYFTFVNTFFQKKSNFFDFFYYLRKTTLLCGFSEVHQGNYPGILRKFRKFFSKTIKMILDRRRSLYLFRYVLYRELCEQMILGIIIANFIFIKLRNNTVDLFLLSLGSVMLKSLYNL